jgi:hypothetical protein
VTPCPSRASSIAVVRPLRPAPSTSTSGIVVTPRSD